MKGNLRQRGLESRAHYPLPVPDLREARMHPHAVDPDRNSQKSALFNFLYVMTIGAGFREFLPASFQRHQRPSFLHWGRGVCGVGRASPSHLPLQSPAPLLLRLPQRMRKRKKNLQKSALEWLYIFNLVVSWLWRIAHRRGKTELNPTRGRKERRKRDKQDRTILCITHEVSSLVNFYSHRQFGE